MQYHAAQVTTRDPTQDPTQDLGDVAQTRHRVSYHRVSACVVPSHMHMCMCMSVGGEKLKNVLEVVSEHVVRVQSAGERETHGQQLLHSLARHRLRHVEV